MGSARHFKQYTMVSKVIIVVRIRELAGSCLSELREIGRSRRFVWEPTSIIIPQVLMGHDGVGTENI